MKIVLQVAIVLFSLSVLASADSVITFGSRIDQNPTDIIDWTQLGVDGTSLTSSQVVFTFGGNTGLVGNTNLTNFMRADEGATWVGNFDFGESLVWTGSGRGAGPGPLELSLANPVGSFGFSIQSDAFGPFTATVQAFDAANNSLFTQTFTGVSNNLENGSALFIGLGDLTGVNISQILISTVAGKSINDFAIDDPSFTYTTATPEPRAIALLLSALLGVAGTIRRFRK